MIIEYGFAQDLLELLENKLINDQSSSIVFYPKNVFANRLRNLDELSDIYNYQMPIFSADNSNSNTVLRTHYSYLAKEGKIKHPDLYSASIEEEVEEMIKQVSLGETIYDAINNKISNLTYNYKNVFKITSSAYPFDLIEDELIILNVLRSRYVEALEDTNKSVKLFPFIHLNSEITSLVLQIYIRFIDFRLKLINPNHDSQSTPKVREKFQFTWQGQQKDLIELFVELRDKNWINDFKYGTIKQMSNSILSLFDISSTQNSDTTDTSNSFYQALKGGHEPKTKKRVFDKILGDITKRKFNDIKPNSSKR